MNSSIEVRSKYGEVVYDQEIILPWQCPNETCHARFEVESYEGSEFIVYTQNNYMGGYVNATSPVLCKYVLWFHINFLFSATFI